MRIDNKGQPGLIWFMFEPRAASEWTRDGFMSGHAPTAATIQEAADSGRHARLKGFIFAGAGWYPAHKVMAIEVEYGRFELRFYNQDPRPAWLALAQTPERP
jgi:hypothetical protein